MILLLHLLCLCAFAPLREPLTPSPIGRGMRKLTRCSAVSRHQMQGAPCCHRTPSPPCVNPDLFRARSRWHIGAAFNRLRLWIKSWGDDTSPYSLAQLRQPDGKGRAMTITKIPQRWCKLCQLPAPVPPRRPFSDRRALPRNRSPAHPDLALAKPSATPRQ